MINLLPVRSHAGLESALALLTRLPTQWAREFRPLLLQPHCTLGVKCALTKKDLPFVDTP